MKGLYKKLAFQNLLKNKNVYLPYIMAQTLMVALFYNLASLAGNTNIASLPGGASIQQTLSYGTMIMALFVMTFLFYVNSFLIKQRKKEYGLYKVLGMEHRHLKKVVFYETCMANIVSFVLGILSGVVFSGLLYMILLRVMGEAAAFVFGVSSNAIVSSFFLFGFLFLIVLAYNLRQLKRVNLREMLQGAAQGEREPKSKKGMVAFGVISLAIGYGIALLVQNVFASLFLFFVAAIFVIMGTYALFTAGSIFFLKKIKADEKRFYTPRFFTAVSGLLHRMKQNAAGLAGICVLSTMILVTCSVSAAVYFGQEQAISKTFPSDIIVNMNNSTDSDKDMEYVKAQVELAAQKAGISVEDVSFAPLDDVDKDMGAVNEKQKVKIALSGTDEQKIKCGSELKLNEDGGHTYSSAYFFCKQDPREGAPSYRAMYGGLLFLGVFMGVIFMTATVLMIYYKQISEGYEDRDRYVIMRKVGMSSEEVKASIQSQILLVFFLPLAMAAVHILAATKVMAKICGIMSIGLGTVVLCTLGTVLLFSLIYIVVYRQTANVYYTIVDRH
ncbi:MAG: ABC transporter permease [Lachnospiraceae bacterium]|nr:ABC transporter permease [Lachnospiraceae bacterium]